MGKTLQDFDLPRIAQPMNFQTTVQHEIQEEYDIVVDPSHLQTQHSLNSDQKYVFDKIMTHVNNDLPGVFFVDEPGGTGKTFLYKALLAEVRSRGLLALATASSGAAVNNMPGGRTAHSRFNIPIQLDTNSTCYIPIQTGTAGLIRLARLIIWDEASMAKRQAIEALHRTMQDIMGSTLPFGGKLMLMGGDFRQVLPVVKRGTRAQIVDASFRMSPLWSSTEKLRLSINMRALNDPWFSEFLLRVGDGTEETTNGNFIKIPDAMTIPFTTNDNSIRDLINIIYPSLDSNTHSPDYISSRAILTTRNDSVDEVNDYMINIFNGDECVYYSFDTTEDDHRNLYPVEFLNSLTVGGLPPHKLRLKIGCPVILLRNLNPSDGLCNGTRLVCKGFQPNAIDAEIVVGEHVGKRVLLPRIPLSLSEEDMFPFKLIRRQFPIRPSFSMTINKAQGQTIPHVGIYLPEPVFCHGQLYVALSRGTSMENTKVLVHPSKKIKAGGVFTNNVVYQEILLDQ
ncbi:uncharacterized protein LOC143569228 [Bidens hawaiensis]|uniref:uncharacterized protein LOC143569228 n=1 Tax=Bidens hawaiensis TaxID=980011 RepID=UPI00404B3D89